MSAFSLADAPARGFRVGESGLTASTAALIVSAIPTGEWANDDERRALEAALTPELCRPPTLPLLAALTTAVNRQFEPVASQPTSAHCSIFAHGVHCSGGGGRGVDEVGVGVGRGERPGAAGEAPGGEEEM